MSAAAAASEQMRDRLLEIRDEHASAPGLRERLGDANPESARRAYLEEQLAMAERLAATMAAAMDPIVLAGQVVAELHHTFGVYLAVIQRLDCDGILRIVASAGPLAEPAGGDQCRGVDPFVVGNRNLFGWEI